MAGHKSTGLVALNASQPWMLCAHQGLRDRMCLELWQGCPVAGLDAPGGNVQG